MKHLFLRYGLMLLVTGVITSLASFSFAVILPAQAFQAPFTLVTKQTITSTLPVSQTGNVIYFNNSQDGVLTATFTVSGTPPLTFIAGQAFNQQGTRKITSDLAVNMFTLTYSVSVSDINQPEINYTISDNSADEPKFIKLSYMIDKTPPELSPSTITEDSSFLYYNGERLYYTYTTSLVPLLFVLNGTVTDSQSGVSWLISSLAWSRPPVEEPKVTGTAWEATYKLQDQDRGNGVITITALDYVANSQVYTMSYEVDSLAPVVTTTIPITLTNQPFTITWLAQDTQSGGHEMTLWFRKGNNWQKVTTSSNTITQTLFAPKDGDGLYEFAVTAQDNLGNGLTAPITTQTQVLYDNTVPTVVLTVPQFIAEVKPFELEWLVTDDTAGISSTFVAWRGADHATWTVIYTASIGKESFTPPQTGLYYFVITATDKLGLVSVVNKTIKVGVEKVYLPLILHDYAPPTPIPTATPSPTATPTSIPFGGFNSSQSWFDIHGGFNLPPIVGTGLPATIASGKTYLGDKNLTDGHIGVGYGGFTQTFTVDKPYLKFHYQIFTWDLAKSKTSGKYFDTFEVYIQEGTGKKDYPMTISNDNRNSHGCGDADINPDNKTIKVGTSGGLVVCGGYSGSADDPLQLRNFQRNVTLDLQAFKGKVITLYLVVWSREYNTPAYNDQGTLNTWVELDNIRVTDTP